MRTSKRHGNGGKINSHRPTLRSPANGPSTVSTAPRPATHSSAVELKPKTREITNAAIAEAAYFLWQQRGGNEIDNWLDAEATLKANLKR